MISQAKDKLQKEEGICSFEFLLITIKLRKELGKRKNSHI
jgi:hypothetical protein